VPEDERITTSLIVKASPQKIFDLICTPAGHVQIDGSQMLRATAAGAPVTQAGDTFVMHMDRRPLGDIPGLAEYDVTVVITAFNPNVLLEWSVLDPKLGLYGNVYGRRTYGHRYGYQLTPNRDGSTTVTSYCDWSGVPAHRKEAGRWPIVPIQLLEKSLNNLACIVADGR
jgi:hypothetical protein